MLYYIISHKETEGESRISSPEASSIQAARERAQTNCASGVYCTTLICINTSQYINISSLSQASTYSVSTMEHYFVRFLNGRCQLGSASL